jgi:hypothetical protein
MIKGTALLIGLALVLTGCRKPIEHPELADPVYRDLRKEANKAYTAYKDREKNAVAAKKAFDQAPIRTGARLDAQDEYFQALAEQEKYAEKYRYFALKAELRQKYDVSAYPRYFQDQKPWPDQEQYEAYEVEKRLVNAPREWNPEDRIKQRKLAAQEKATSLESHE